jgi:uncharacterized protein YlaI
MRLVLCDRCGKEIGGKTKLHINDWSAPMTKDPIRYELCTECSNKVRGFIEKNKE